MQGDHKKKVQEALRKIGFNAETR
ncbi:MAG: hypothetical protein L6265_12660 [Thermoplasmatales archaeon]|nr:hypothetical protein [Thermoplasmatales archaeon]